MRRPSLVATDLDGTVVRTDGSISSRTVAALSTVEEAGVPLVFVTGRLPRWMHPVAEATGRRGLAVCANGAVVYDLHEERVVDSFPLAAEAALEVVQMLREGLPSAWFAVETVDGFLHEPDYRTHWDPGPRVRVGVVEDLLDQPVVKLLVRDEAMDVDVMLATAREVVGDVVELSHSGALGLLEISAPGVSKATTLARLCARWGVAAEDVLAFGDMPNDLPMLAWAGTAYAMGNAHPEVLAAVPRRTLSNDADGVAVVLERVFTP